MHYELYLENLELKKRLIEAQLQLLHMQYAAVLQEMERFSTEYGPPVHTEAVPGSREDNS
ncbi:hypothetical protein Back11_59530 [Paenibacillus baekrokdamisoli]|uniref:Uncharacterized protein n=1 Tax=Paenibacillus baekrokdamisoli TaxID=1712516 RepID=A0A3G9JKF6_9BACL|nr:hypothetical protein [Paenibacillus baekrokdamisoli]BBH24608.1 hypothetical protein Back11_59530 [Paenibacillus baekrokdamisoli]